jgi:hypothetical protein
MKKLILLAVAGLLSSCSSVQVVDSWKNTDMSAVKNEKIVVIARTADNVVRARVEKDMVTSLNSSGFEAIQSYDKLPMLKIDSKLSQDKVDALKQQIIDKGYNFVMMLALKDKQEYLKTTTDNAGYAYPGYPGYYGGGFYRGFGTYYGSLYNYGYSTSTTEVANKYIVECVVYDITKPQGKSLIAVVTVDIDDPSSLSKTGEDLAKKVVQEMTNK